jgi:tetratricopeptide (TPR) repeat protein
MKRIINLVMLLSFFALSINAQEQVSGVSLKNRNEAKVAYNMAIESIKENNFTIALEYLSAALDLNPEFAQAYLIRGKTNLELGRKDEAIQDFGMALQLDMNLGEAYFYRGYANLSDQPDLSVLNDFDRTITVDYINLSREIILVQYLILQQHLILNQTMHWLIMTEELQSDCLVIIRELFWITARLSIIIPIFLSHSIIWAA